MMLAIYGQQWAVPANSSTALAQVTGVPNIITPDLFDPHPELSDMAFYKYMCTAMGITPTGGTVSSLATSSSKSGFTPRYAAYVGLATQPAPASGNNSQGGNSYNVSPAGLQRTFGVYHISLYLIIGLTAFAAAILLAYAYYNGWFNSIGRKFKSRRYASY